ncbi:MAG: cation transporter [Chlorobi bacterium]|nr:cation transporter [Chlorobiota bacterium]
MKIKKNGNKGILIGVISFIGNILLFFLKFWAATVTNSIALMADAWHTVSDSISTIIVIIGIKISSKPADEEHPYGHQRAETIAAMFIGFFLLVVAFEFGKDAIVRFIDHVKVNYGLTGIWVMTVSVVVKELMARITIRTGKKKSSEALIADGWHHRSDAISSFIILVGILFNRYVWWMDSFLTLILAIYISYIAVRIVGKAISPLMGSSVEKELQQKIIKITNEIYKGKIYPHHFHKHVYGNHIELTFHIILPENMTLKESATLTRNFFRRIKEETGIIATIHIDTESKYENYGGTVS